MDITVLISWGNKLHHRGWDIGFCPFCRGLEVMRVEEIVWRFAVYGVPIVRESKGHLQRCELCARPAQPYFFPPAVGPNDWSPADGFTRLLRQRGHRGKVVRRKERLELRNRSLLTAACDAITMSNMSVMPGLLVGLILGLLLGCGLGVVLLETEILRLAKDAVGAAIIGALSGALVGATAGACGYWWLRRHAVARTFIRRACDFHQMDPDALAMISAEYSPHVHQAVIEVQLDPSRKQKNAAPR